MNKDESDATIAELARHTTVPDGHYRHHWQPGDAVIYPSTTLHEVKPVRAGQRLVSITFI